MSKEIKVPLAYTIVKVESSGKVNARKVLLSYLCLIYLYVLKTTFFMKVYMFHVVVNMFELNFFWEKNEVGPSRP